ncbi:phosphotransferase family protein [Agromyces sp. NPDC056965]|uniref:phosphotransferase family protein n=1 Tax=Agromyces sp. NPDC056965 TaxID=3345983 RepID=UPI00362C8857
MLDDDDRALVVRMGLAEAGEEVTFEPLTGGVSSDIRVLRAGGRTVVLKRALSRLKVAEEWHAPIGRGRAEARWLRYAASVVPDAVPAVLATDPETFAIALEFLPPGRYGTWKSALLSGEVDPAFAGRVGQVIGRIHAASTTAPGLASRFDNQDLFESLRIEPYLRRTAAAAPEAAAPLAEVVSLLEAPGQVLIHGDLSPKNILRGGSSPVLLDAECATWSDPAFDVAFCLSHLALKSVHLPALAAPLQSSAAALRRSYLAEVTWEDPAETDRRVSRILPALLLARVVGASPVEYLDEAARVRVRTRAVAMLADPGHSPENERGFPDV